MPHAGNRPPNYATFNTSSNPHFSPYSVALTSMSKPPFNFSLPGENNKFRFMLLGAGRSGTSLLAALMDEHPEIEVGFELYGNACLRGQDIPDNRDTMFYDRSGSFIERCMQQADGAEKSIWGNKITTEKLGGLNKHNLYNQPPVPVLDTFFNQYLANVKVIYILRDGRACIQSKLRRTKQSLESAVTWWKYAVEIYEFLQPRPQTLFVRYESLVAQPANTLTEIFRFLGVEYDPQVLQGTMSPKLLETYRNPGINQTLAHNFDHQHPCVPMIHAELSRCGYL